MRDLRQQQWQAARIGARWGGLPSLDTDRESGSWLRHARLRHQGVLMLGYSTPASCSGGSPRMRRAPDDHPIETAVRAPSPLVVSPNEGAELELRHRRCSLHPRGWPFFGALGRGAGQPAPRICRDGQSIQPAAHGSARQRGSSLSSHSSTVRRQGSVASLSATSAQVSSAMSGSMTRLSR